MQEKNSSHTVQGGMMPHTEYVNVEKAESIIQEMKQKATDPAMSPLLNIVEVRMRDFLLGLILTAVETGLVQNTPERLEELKAKLIVAFDSGFVLGRESKD